MDQTVKILARDCDSFREVDFGESGELICGQAIKFKVTSATTKLDLLPAGCDLDRLIRQLTCYFLQFFTGRGEAPTFLHVGEDFDTHRDVQVCTAHPDPVIVRFKEDV